MLATTQAAQQRPTAGPTPTPAGRRPPIWTLAVLLLATAVAYSYTATIQGSPLAGDCAWQQSPLACATLPQTDTWLHAGNVALHLFNATLAMVIFLEWMPALAALVGGLWFALHPLQAEAVTLASGRPELLATAFALLTMIIWRRRLPWICLLPFTASLASGPTAVALPAFLALFEISMGGELRRGIRALQAMGLMSAAALVWWIVQGKAPLTAIVSAAPVLGHTVNLLAIPTGLTIWPVVLQSAAYRFAAWMILAAMTGAACRAFRHLRLGFWFIAFLTLTLPVFLFFRGPEAASNRHLYLPMLAVAAIVGRIFSSTRLPMLIPAGALLLAVLTYSRGAVFQSEQALWEEAAQRAPGDLRPRLELAKLAPPRRALDLLLESRALFPNDPRIAAQLGQVYMALNLPGQAVTEFGRAIARTPGRADLHLSRGQALAALSLNDAALSDFEVALAVDPCYGPARAALHLPMLVTCAAEKQNRPH